MNYMLSKILIPVVAACFALPSLVGLSGCTPHDSLERKIPITKVGLIPQPDSITYGSCNIVLPEVVTLSEDLPASHRELLTGTLVDALGVKTEYATNSRAFLHLSQQSGLPEEGYRLTVDSKGIKLEYSTPKGLLWAIQTLRQILLHHSPSPKGSPSIPELSVVDAPDNQWRGFLIDVARHMYSIDYLKKVVDALSLYKINRVQLHLTDDQGWRIEIKRYPELTEQGAWREFDEYDKRCLELAKTDPSFIIDSRYVRNGNEYGGYYTQQQLRDLVEYASERGIEIIPEIDMPGHFSSAIKAFPHLSCVGEAGWGKEFSHPICAGKTENYPFFTAVLDEVMQLFPSTYIHIGADEVEKQNWRNCPQCQRLIAEQGLGNVANLQNYFVGKMSEHIKSRGKKVMAWDDAFVKSNPQDIIYTYWRDWLPESPREITQKGLPLIFMEWGNFYFISTRTDERQKALYEFNLEPKFAGIAKNNLWGYQACVWTEMIPNERKFGQQTFPSLQAFAEVAWGSERNWQDFCTRLPRHLKWLTDNGLHSTTPDFIK